jgi:hypothetical protein
MRRKIHQMNPERRTFLEPEFTSPATKQWRQGPLVLTSFLTQHNHMHPINKNSIFHTRNRHCTAESQVPNQRHKPEAQEANQN